MVKQIPNLLTLLNLFCGCVAAISFLQGRIGMGLIAIFCSLLFDYLDGWLARLLKVDQDLGKQLDSLADVVSFGLVPGIIYYLFFKDFSTSWSGVWKDIIPYAGFAFTLFAALRLAIFNLDVAQTHDFTGLPTPAASIFPVGLIWMKWQDDCASCTEILINPGSVTISLVALCWLMVSKMRLFSLKFQHVRWKGNEVRYLFAGACVLLLILMKEAALPTIVVLYILLSLIYKPGTLTE